MRRNIIGKKISEDIEEAIVTGELKPGMALTSLRKFAQQYDVSYVTMVRAIQMLVDKGLLEKKHGKGIFVTSKAVEIAKPISIYSFNKIFPPKMLESLEKSLNNLGNNNLVRHKDVLGDYYHRRVYFNELAENSMMKSPAIIAVDEGLIDMFAKKGLLLELDELLANSKYFSSKAGFLKEVLAGYNVDGKLYGLPAVFSTPAVFYNKPLLNKYGIKKIPKEWSWQNLLDIAGKCTKLDENGCQYACRGLQFSYLSPNTFMPFVWGNGGNMFAGSKCIIDSPAAIEAIEFVADLHNKYHVCLPLSQVEHDLHLSFFNQKKLAMFIGFYKDYLYLRDNCTFEWGVTSMPVGKLKVTSLPTQGWGISAYSKDPQRAFSVLETMFQNPHYEIICRYSRSIPAWNTKDGDIPAPFCEDYKYGRFSWRNEDDGKYNFLSDQMMQIFNNLTSPAKGCRMIAEKINESV
ncbi:MAG: extracellular solute-binding protein [Lentisphaerae bacterium]|nr:extracellular solute-binding protein [Lentisphaerota bacterium]